MPRPFSKAPRQTVYKRELYDCAECINLMSAAAKGFPAAGKNFGDGRGGNSGKLGQTGRLVPLAQIDFGWDNVPMHRWAQSQMFRVLAFYLRGKFRLLATLN